MCDGTVPCGTCKSRRESCSYRERTWQAKEELRSEVEQLKKHQEYAQTVLEALRHSGDYPSILQRLRDGEPVESIGMQLSNDQQDGPYDDDDDDDDADGSMPSTPSTPFSQTSKNSIARSVALADSYQFDMSAPPFDSIYGPMSNAFSRPKVTDSKAPLTPRLTPTTQPATLATESGDEGSRGRERQWDEVDSGNAIGNWETSVTDPALIRQLLQVFFTMELPLFSTIHEESFMDDFASGAERYCSSALLNAILSVATRYLDLIDPGSGITDLDAHRLVELGDDFAEAATTLLAGQERRDGLPSVQALGILALREAYNEQWHQAEQFASECVKGIGFLCSRAAENEQEQEVRSASLCSAMSLARMILLVRQTDDGEHSPGSHGGSWLEDSAGRAPKDAVQSLPSSRNTTGYLYELTELSCSITSHLQRPDRHATGKDLMKAYETYLNWYQILSEQLKAEGDCTPSVLYIHIYYQHCLLSLFSNFTNSALGNLNICPRTVCGEASRAILDLTQLFCRMFDLCQSPCFLSHFVGAARQMQATLSQFSNTPDSGTDYGSPALTVATDSSAASSASPMKGDYGYGGTNNDLEVGGVR
ncbi:hypothetical protein QBC46DRAFT_438458 [Diplogelasinospora grovesii]|uniref:Xylanolytic transcriptional activator regulatory domain-containing protein n=1 Tax=Diplogelasinospora grovesii TaxID=303347 RepID=A0AAN6N847_9PEZI|nr:hypothetical protein QBC46DRAFT_438458 [Diplogelasinospora grovesii]